MEKINHVQMKKNAYIEITRKCNLHCPHCYNRSDSKNNEFMSFEQLRFILSSPVFSATNAHISLSGGEPLCHPQIDEILNYLVEKEYDVTVVTNGMLAQEKLLPYLLMVKNKLTVQISLDGATAETNAKIRGDEHFHKAIAFMKILIEKNFKSITARMTISKININEVEKFFHLCTELEAIPTYGFVSRRGCASDCWESMELPERAKMLVSPKINNMYEQESVYNKKIRENIKTLKILPTMGCPFLESKSIDKPLIKVNGDVQPCQSLYDPVYKMGNVFSDSIEVIFGNNNPRFILLKEYLTKRQELMMLNQCSECLIKCACGNGCPAVSLNKGDILSTDEDCEYRRNCTLASWGSKQILSKKSGDECNK